MTLRTKLALATTAVAAATTVLALVAVQVPVETMQRRTIVDRIESRLRVAIGASETRLAAVRARCRRLARSVRLLAALTEGDPADAERIAQDELRDALGAAADPAGRALFFRLLDAAGRPLEADAATAGPAPPALEHALDALGTVALRGQATGWLPVPDGAVEIVATPIVDPATGDAAGALVMGFAPAGAAEPAAPDAGAVGTALWLDGRLVAAGGPDTVHPALDAALAGWTGEPLRTLPVDGTPWLVLVRPLDVAPGFPPAAQVAFASLAPAERERRRLRLLVLGAGAAGLVLALGLSAALASQLARPARALALGTAAIARGDYGHRVAVRGRDELAELARAFNGMAAELAQKARYQQLLDVVADPTVAAALLAGGVELGGELRDVGVLFCDIRGFTALAARLAPREVVGLVNDHMTAMTRVIHAHGGVVDKFMGDMVMALFGAPRATGREPTDLARCALALVAERTRLNAGAAYPVAVGIGIVMGEVVAGCTGAAERLSYTVLGARVNVASRLCQAAAPMEVLLDQATRTRLGDAAGVEPVAPVIAKGYAHPLVAYRLVRVATEAAA